VICLNNVRKNIPGVYFAHNKAGKETAAIFGKENRKNILLLYQEHLDEEYFSSFIKEYEVKSPSYTKIKDAPIHEIESRVLTLLESGYLPDAVLTSGAYAAIMSELLLQKDIDLKNACRIVMMGDFSEYSEFTGLRFDPPYAEAATLIANELTRLIINHAHPVFHHPVESSLLRVGFA